MNYSIATFDRAGSSDRRATGLLSRLWFLEPTYVLFLTLLYLPVSRNALKASLFGLAVVALLVQLALGRERLRIDTRVARWLGFYVLLGVAYCTYGVFRGNPGALFSMLLYCVWPIVYVLLCGRLNSLLRLRRMGLLIAIGTIATGLTITASFLVAAGFLPSVFDLKLTETSRVAIYEGHTHANFVGLSTLIFTVPFLTGALVVGARGAARFAPQWLLWAALGAGVAGTLLGGRRAGILVIVLMPFLGLLLMKRLPRLVGARWLRKVFAFGLAGLAFSVVLGGVMGSAFGWTLSSQVEWVQDGFDFKGADSARARADQAGPLLDGFVESPAIGAGFGAVARGSVRSERPWEYELQYLVLLFNTGIVGTIAYALGVVWLLAQARRVIRRGDALGEFMIPLVLGLVAFLIANASNPYFQAYGHLWTLFIPLAVVNLHLIHRQYPLKA